jgi:hypothetical protein
MPRAAQSIAAEEQIATRAAGQFRASTGGDGVALEDVFPMAARVSTGRPRARQRRETGGSRSAGGGDSGSDSSGEGEPPPPEGGRGRRLNSRKAIERWLAERRRALDALLRARRST